MTRKGAGTVGSRARPAKLASPEAELERLRNEVNAQAQALTEAAEQQAATAEILNVISQSAADLKPVLDTIVATAARLCGAQYAVVFKLEDGKFVFMAANNPNTDYIKLISSVPPQLNRGSLSGRTVLERAAVHIPDVLKDPEHQRKDAQKIGKYRALLGVPLMSQGEPIGVIFLVRTRPKPFTEKQIELVTGFAHQASIAFENARMFTELKQHQLSLAEKSMAMEQLSSQLAKYLSPQVYESIFTGRQEVKVASRRKKLTAFFSDVAGFTEAVERLESEELTLLLNHYLTEMARIALEHGATIDKYVGDAILIFFGDPDTRGVKVDALACVKMAIAMRDRLRELGSIWRDAGIERPLQCRIGINTGYCTVGNFGSEDRMDYTIIGGGVNLASRLESAATPGEILISYETYVLVKDEIACENHGEISAKGIAYPVTAYRVVGRHVKPGERPGRIHEDRPNLRLDLELDAMSEEERAQAAAVLQAALERIRKPH